MEKNVRIPGIPTYQFSIKTLLSNDSVPLRFPGKACSNCSRTARGPYRPVPDIWEVIHDSNVAILINKMSGRKPYSSIPGNRNHGF